MTSLFCIECGRNGGGIPNGLSHEHVQALLHILRELAGLLGAYLAFGQGCRSGQQVGIGAQLLLAVPALQLLERLTHFGRLFMVEVELAIEPPVRQ